MLFRVVGGQLSHIGAGIIVAFDQRGPVRGNGNVLAHMTDLRDYHGGLLRQGDCLMDHGNLIAFEYDACVRVLIKDVVIVVRGVRNDFAGFGIHPNHNAVLTGIVAKAVAASEL